MKEMELSETQRLAVETVGKNVCVSAGAGSGKTRVLVERFIHLVTRHRISPSSILAITFTDKAANEMKRRIVERLAQENLAEERRQVENAYIGTLHAFSARLLREHPLEAGVDPYFRILESHEADALQEKVLNEIIEREAEQREVFDLLRIYGERSVTEGILQAYRTSRNSEEPFKILLRRRSPGEPAHFASQLENLPSPFPLPSGERVGVRGSEDIDSLLALRKKLKAAGREKERIRKAQETLDDWVSYLREEESDSSRESFIRLALQFEKAYEELKREGRALDFDDLQLYAVKLLGSDSPISKALSRIYQNKFSEILVDEFQDTNRLQNRLVDLIRREGNLFIVGDFKQSIYSFRGTEVEIFLEKKKSFDSPASGTLISLGENYRSRPKLIDFVNRFFDGLWKEDEIPFERLEAIRKEAGDQPRVERLRLDPRDGESIDELRIREARTLARHIQSLVKNEGHSYRDIALLFEAMTPVHFYEQELARTGVPYYVVSTRGFYSQPEIRDVMSFLSALENPKRDIPLAAALRSPLFQISDDTLFWLTRPAPSPLSSPPRRGRGKGEGVRSLIEAALNFESIQEISEGEGEKLAFFKKTFEAFLEEKDGLGISELIEKIYRVTGFDLYVQRFRQGERRFANLRKLVELAREWESREAVHLSDFVRAVRGLETRDIRESQAQVEAEEGNVVRLMSIHMAKGLEFPVVILPDLGRKDPSQGGRFAFSVEEGLGIEDTLTFRRVKAGQERVNAQESKRKLYVAMTRAEEKLILSGPRTESEQDRPFHQMATWAHWVDAILSQGNWEIRSLSEAPREPFPFERRKALAQRKSIRSRLENSLPIPIRKEREPQAAVSAVLENLSRPERVSFKRIDLPVSAFLLFARDPEAYFQHYEIGMPSQFEIKEEEPEQEHVINRAPTAAEFGTRVHQILEQALLRRLTLRGIEALVFRFTQELGEAERGEMLELTRSFIQSGEAKEILGSKSFHPELPFSLRLPHGLVQGTMDLLYQRPEGDWVILDYKTSQVTPETVSSQGEEYRLQMELYALAVWKILGVPPAEARIHFLRAGRNHRIVFSSDGMEGLYEKFARLQEAILAFRLTRTFPDKFWSGQRKATELQAR